MKKQVLICLTASLFILLLSFSLGEYPLNFASIFEFGSPDAEIFWRLRLPRTLCAFFAGAGLSVCGLVFQAIFRNPLATPYTLGVSAGAAFGASIFFKFGHSISLLGSLGCLSLATSGGFLSMLMVYSIAKIKNGFSTSIMLLSGIIVNYFFAGLVMFLQYLSNAGEAARTIRWMLGAIGVVHPARIFDLCLVVISCSLILHRIAFELDMLAISDDVATSRGVDVRRVKIIAFLAVGIMLSIVVSIAGPIGFVGIMIPHACRMAFGVSNAKIYPIVFFFGGSFLVLCDLFARIVISPSELPVGVVTSILGGPFFLWILLKNSKYESLF